MNNFKFVAILAILSCFPIVACEDRNQQTQQVQPFYDISAIEKVAERERQRRAAEDPKVREEAARVLEEQRKKNWEEGKKKLDEEMLRLKLEQEDLEKKQKQNASQTFLLFPLDFISCILFLLLIR